MFLRREVIGFGLYVGEIALALLFRGCWKGSVRVGVSQGGGPSRQE